MHLYISVPKNSASNIYRLAHNNNNNDNNNNNNKIIIIIIIIIDRG